MYRPDSACSLQHLAMVLCTPAACPTASTSSLIQAALFARSAVQLLQPYEIFSEQESASPNAGSQNCSRVKATKDGEGADFFFNCPGHSLRGEMSNCLRLVFSPGGSALEARHVDIAWQVLLACTCVCARAPSRLAHRSRLRRITVHWPTALVLASSRRL